MDKCPLCRGTGQSPRRDRDRDCGNCGGTGVKPPPVRKCPSCHGYGGRRDRECLKCEGIGYISS